MGLTVHYSEGKAGDHSKIDDCVNFVREVAQRLPCRYEMVDAKLGGKLDDWLNPGNQMNGQLVTVRQKGIILFLDEGAEPLAIIFDYDTLEFCNYFISVKDGTLNKTGFFCKTQYAKNFLSTHHTVCKLLAILKTKYLPQLHVVDDGKYFGVWDMQRLVGTIERWDGIMANFAEIIDETAKDVGLKFEGAGMELY
ncbi:MAG TPA: hypothetical protein VE973_00425, partial [Candidatus Limnocylindria bacterium]|nr:hypothetical protein [Candidatus Limnocylindria bacterium]